MIMKLFGLILLILYLLLLCVVSFMFITGIDLLLNALCIKIKNMDSKAKKGEIDDDSR